LRRGSHCADIFDDDHSGFALYRTEIGQLDVDGPRLSDDELLAQCATIGDERGSLKFLLQQIAPPRDSTRTLPPPVASSSSPRRALRELHSGSTTTTSTTHASSSAGVGASSQSHSKSGSLSSRSSAVSDVLAQPEIYDSGSESGAARGLHRSRGASRRPATANEYARAPGSMLLSVTERQKLDDESDMAVVDEMAGLALERRGQTMRASEHDSARRHEGARRPSMPRNASSGENARERGHQGEWDRQYTSAASMYASVPSPPMERHDRMRSETAVHHPHYAQPPDSSAHGRALQPVKSMDELRSRAPPAPPAGSMPPPPSQVHGAYSAYAPGHARPPAPPSAGTPAPRRPSAESHPMRSPPFDPRLAADPYGRPMPHHAADQHMRARAPSFGDPRASRAPTDARLMGPRHAPPGAMGPPPRPGTVAPVVPYSGAPMQPNASFDGRYATAPRPHSVTNEFGARIPGPYAGPAHGARGTSPAPFPSRPHTYHDAPQQQHYRPVPPSQAPQPVPIYMSREDAFTSAHFPASSSRQVSEFQRIASAQGSLTPGMTVQERLRAQQHAPHPQPSFGPREPRAWTGPRSYEPDASLARASPRGESPSRYNPAHGAPYVYAGEQQQRQMRAVPPSADYGPYRAQPASAGAHYGAQPSHHPGQSMQQVSPQMQHQVPRRASAERSSAGSHSSQEQKRGRALDDAAGSAGLVRSSRPEPVSPVDARRRSEDEGGGAHRLGEAADDEDDDALLKMRPLPKPPQQAASPEKPASSAPSLSLTQPPSPPDAAQENLAQAAHWASLFSGLDSEGTVSSAGSATLRADSRSTDGSRSFSSEASSGTITAADFAKLAAGGKKHAEAMSADDGDSATFGSFVDDDSDDEDGAGTWAQPLDSSPALLAVQRQAEAATAEPARPVTPLSHGTTLHDPGVSPRPTSPHAGPSPRRPILTISIADSTSTTVSRATSPQAPRHIAPQSQPSPTPQSASPHLQQLLASGDGSSAGLATPTSAVSQTPSGSGVNRRTSFAHRDGDWAPRPPPEQLYENLDDFFPKHDLDKPVLETLLPGSPLVGSPKAEMASMASVLTPASPVGAAAGRAGRSGHKKSIRIVAQDRKRILERSEHGSRRRLEGMTPLERRRSTKLWGTKVVEMTPSGQEVAPPSATPSESPSSEKRELRGLAAVVQC
jgi:mitogen-activated protein kinase kinase kinase